MRRHLHHGMPCAAHRHNALAKYLKEAFMKAFTDALTNRSIHLGSSSRRVSSCSSNSNNSSNSKSFCSKNTIICDNLRYLSSALFPPCSTALRSYAQVTPLLTLTAAALPNMLRGTPGRQDTSCSWFGSNRLGILILAAALFP